jgi:hypothetical protein
MRAVVMLLVIAFATEPMLALADGPTARRRRVVRCCLELDLPDLPPGPVCAEVRGRRGLRPRRACRLLGGRPIGRGDCSPAACQAPPA